MAYIGRGLDKISNVEKLDNLTFDGSSTSYSLLKGGVSFTPSSANNILLSIDGVVQAGNFTVSGSTIDFGTAVSASSTCDFILHYGVGVITTPSDGSVTGAKIASSAVDLTSKVTGTLPVANGGTNLTSGFANGITMADQWRLTTSFAITSQSDTFVTSNLEQVDTSGQGTLGSAMTESSGVFTFPETGIYLVSTIAQFYIPDDARWIQASIYVTTNNSSYTQVSGNYGFTQITQSSNTYIAVPTSTYVDVTDTSNVKVKFAYARVDPNSVNVTGDSNINQTHYTFIRLGDT